jgi:hypothetical protein
MPTMRLEILTPRRWTHLNKEFLKMCTPDWVAAPNYRTVRINAPEVSNGVRLHRVAQVLGLTKRSAMQLHSKALPADAER